MVDKKIIEVNNYKEVEKQGLSAEERCAIIEAILNEYTSFFRSIYHCTISYCIESFRLLDRTNLSEDSDVKRFVYSKTILKEYLDSKYAKNSTNKLYRVLKKTYDELCSNKKIIGKKEITIPIDYNLNFEQRSDLKYYVNTIINYILETDKPVSVFVDKQNSHIVVKGLD
jgi:hypothetical protein